MIDFRSDTVTKPSAAMKDAMFAAPVGDDVFGEDPSIIELEQYAANLFGKEAGLFCSSGTQTNQIAINVHVQPGGEVICHEESHIYKYEGGGIAKNSGASVRLLKGDRGRLEAADIAQWINPAHDVHFPLTQLVSLEDTANRGGGSVYSFDKILEIRALCDSLGLPLHLDGARVCNALAPTVQQTGVWNRVALHHLTYHKLRERFPELGSQMVCNAIYSVSRTSRMVFQHAQSPFNLNKLAGKPLPLLRFSDSCPVYFDRHTLSVKNGQLSMFTLDGRMRFALALTSTDEANFNEKKLREIVLSCRADGVYELSFLFDDEQG